MRTQLYKQEQQHLDCLAHNSATQRALPNGLRFECATSESNVDICRSGLEPQQISRSSTRVIRNAGRDDNRSRSGNQHLGHPLENTQNQRSSWLAGV